MWQPKDDERTVHKAIASPWRLNEYACANARKLNDLYVCLWEEHFDCSCATVPTAFYAELYAAILRKTADDMLGVVPVIDRFNGVETKLHYWCQLAGANEMLEPTTVSATLSKYRALRNAT
jgi:hypothetical protein